MIVGQPGAGKSTLARDLGAITGLPVHHMDRIHWQPGWVERPKDEKIALANAVEASERWIFEGGLTVTYYNRLARCDTLIVLDLPLHLRAWRVAKRTVTQYGRTRADLTENCPERFSLEFWHYIWRTRQSGRARVLALMDAADGATKVIHLQNPAAVRAYLAALR